MTNRIAESLQTTRAALRRAAILRGLSLVVAVLVGTVIVIGYLDWAVHFDGRNTRLILAIVTSSAVAAAVTWWVVLPAVTRLSDFQIAKRIETAHPEFSGRLSSSVEFLEHASDGSQQLQQHAIDRAAGSVSRLSPDQLVDRSPLRKAASLAALLVVLATILFATRPAEASTAVSRLVFPLRSIPWPRTTDLRIIDEAGATTRRDDVLTVVRGEVFEVLAENTRGQLPDNSVIEHRVGTRGKSLFEPLQPITLDATLTGEAGRTVLTPAKGPVYFRAVGGDHWSPWYRLDVVSPPTLNDVKMEIMFPEYLAREPESIAQDGAELEVLVGSRLRISGTASKPVQTASIVFQDRQEPVEIAEDGVGIEAELLLDKEGIFSWSIELTDENGVQNPRPVRYEVRVKTDTSPDVFFDQPGEDLQATATAALPIKAMASDDQGLQSMRLEVAETSGATSTLATADLGDETEPREATIETEFDLAERGAKPGQQFVLQAIASDSYDIDGESHVADSDKRTITIVTPEVKATELDQRQATLLTELGRIADAQVKTRDSLKELQIQNRETGVLRRVDLDLLKRTELDQQRIIGSLFDEPGGLEQRLLQLSDEFDQNKLDASESRTAIDELAGELGHIQGRVVSALEEQLSALRKEAEETLTEAGSPDAAAVPDLDSKLESVGQLQSDIVDSLRSVLADTAAWKRRTDLLTALTEIATQQDQLIRDTNRLGDLTLSGTTETDRRQFKSDGARVALRQERLIEDFNTLLESAAKQQASRELTAFLQLVGLTNPSLKMREAVLELRSGRAAAASQLQNAAAKILGDLIDLLRKSRDSADAQVSDVRQLRQAVRSLAVDEADIATQLQAASEPVSLAPRQAELRRQLERYGRQLTRQNVASAADPTAKAIAAMQSAESHLASGDRKQANESIAAAVAALNQLVTALKQREQALQSGTIKAALKDAVTELREMAAQQTEICGETQRFEAMLKETGRRTRRQSREVLAVAKKQGTLADTVGQLREELGPIEVVPQLLTAIEDHMRAAERSLSKRVTDGQTVESQQAATRELLALAESLTDSSANYDSTAEGPGQAGSGQPPAEASLVPMLTRLKLIRSLQQSVASATKRLSERNSTAEERKQLAQRQREVARLTEELLQALSKDEAK